MSELGRKTILWGANFDGEDECLYLDMQGGYVRLENDTPDKALEQLAEAIADCLEGRATLREKEEKKKPRIKSRAFMKGGRQGNHGAPSRKRRSAGGGR